MASPDAGRPWTPGRARAGGGAANSSSPSAPGQVSRPALLARRGSHPPVSGCSRPMLQQLRTQGRQTALVVVGDMATSVKPEFRTHVYRHNTAQPAHPRPGRWECFRNAAPATRWRNVTDSWVPRLHCGSIDQTATVWQARPATSGWTPTTRYSTSSHRLPVRRLARRAQLATAPTAPVSPARLDPLMAQLARIQSWRTGAD